MSPSQPWWRRAWLFLGRYHPTTLAIGAAGLGTWGNGWSMAEWPFWVLNGGALAFVAGQAVAGQRVVKSARAMQEEFKVAIFDQLGPLARELSKMARESSSKRKARLDATIRDCVAAASGLAGESTRTRATYFKRAQRNGRDAFVPAASLGRGDQPQSEFVKGNGSIEGDAVWRAAERDEPRFVGDVQGSTLRRAGSREASAYRTLIASPLRDRWWVSSPSTR